MRAGNVAGPRKGMPVAEAPQLIAAMAEGIAHRGKAVAGQKTMIDAWGPASDAVLRGDGLADIAAAAETGAASTAGMVATLGRAARLGERSLGHPDPGAVSAAMIVSEMTHAFARVAGEKTA